MANKSDVQKDLSDYWLVIYVNRRRLSMHAVSNIVTDSNITIPTCAAQTGAPPPRDKW